MSGPHVGSLALARYETHRDASAGTVCPCCDQHVRVYRRRLNASMVRALLTMYRAGGVNEYVHTPTLLAGKRGEEARLSYWQLTQESDGTRTDGGRRGWWRVTQRGELFLSGHITVMSHVLVYNGRCLRMVGEPMSVRDALGAEFDLHELMSHDE